MADNYKRVVQRDSTEVDGDGSVVREKTQATSTKADPKLAAINFIWYVYGFIAIILALRFVLKLTGANPTNSFVDIVYSISGVFSAPFDSIFGVAKTTSGAITSVFEPSILVAIAVYALIAWAITKLFTLNESRSAV